MSNPPLEIPPEIPLIAELRTVAVITPPNPMKDLLPVIIPAVLLLPLLILETETGIDLPTTPPPTQVH